MKKTSLILLSMLLLSSVLSAQESIMFDKQFIFDDHGSYPRDLKQTPDGGYVCAGGIGFSMYDDRYLLFKTDSLGELEWYNYSDSSAVHSTLWAVDLTKTGGYVGIGSTQDNPDWHNSGAIVMYDSLGDTLWTKQYAFDNPFIRGTKYEINFYDGKCTNDNCILAVGSIMEDNLGTDPNPIVVKTNLQGDTLWTWRLFEEGNRIIIMSVAETQEGDYVAVGRADKPIVDTEKTTYAPQRGFIVKISQAGELIYLKEWTDIDYNLFDDVAINSEGELLIAGIYFNHPPEYPDDSYHALLVKTDDNGETIFYKQIEYGKNIGIRTLSVSENDDIILVSMYESLLGYAAWHYDVMLQRYSNFGALLWTQYIGGQDVDVWPHSVISSNDNGVAFCGSFSTDTSLCSWLVKTDSLGNGPYGQGWINAVETNMISDEFNIYPNPAVQNFNISSLDVTKVEAIIIYDISGQIVKMQKAVNFPMDISDLKNGIYIVKLSVNDKIIRKKLIVEH
jgi:hypothetical protein